MPRKTSRWIQLSGLRHLRSLQILTDGVDERFDKPLMQPQDLNPWMLDDDEMFYEDYGLQELIELASVVEHTRYNHRPKYSPAPSAALAERVISDRVIESWCHRHRRSFYFIFSLIRDHPIFCQMEGRPQVSLKLQLAAALARFCGKGTTIAQFATKFKVSHGSMIKYCSRVSEALLAVERKFLRWPDAARRVRLRNYGLSEFGFSGYIGNVDGTHFYLCQAPVFECYLVESAFRRRHLLSCCTTPFSLLLNKYASDSAQQRTRSCYTGKKRCLKPHKVTLVTGSAVAAVSTAPHG